MEEINQERGTGELYTIGRLIQDSFSVIRRDFGILLKIALLSTIFSLVFNIFSEGLTGRHQPGFILLSIFLSLFSIVVALCLNIAQIFAINNLSDDKPVTLGESFKTALKKCGSYFWVVILTCLAILGGFILLVVPGIIFGVWFSFSSYVLVLEDIRGVSALKRSKQLVKGNGWYVFVITFVVGAIFTLVALLPTGILWLISHLIAATPLNMKFFMIFYAVPAATACIPFYVSCLLLFKNLREVKGDAVISVPYRLTAGK